MSLRDQLKANPPRGAEPVTLSDGSVLLAMDMPGTERSEWWDETAAHKETCPEKKDAQGKTVTKEKKDAKGVVTQEPVLEPSTTDGMTQDDFVRDTLIVRTMCDPESKERVFLPEDVGTFKDWGSADLDKLWRAALKVTGLASDAVEAAAKN